MAVRLCSESDAVRWDQFVCTHAEATSYHRWNWRGVFQRTFGWPALYLVSEKDSHIRGILPLFCQQTVFEKYLSSMPHLKGGGIVAEDRDTELELLAHAVQLSSDMKAAYLELRHSTDRGLPLASRSDKISAILSVPAQSESLWRQLEKKTRNLVRKSMTFGMAAAFGGVKLLDEFYGVYRRNMRDLGSPSYSRQFFGEILAAFPRDTYLCAIRKETATVAAAFLVGFRDTLEVTWASSDRKYLALKPNMFLYWHLLAFAGEHGYRWFDFGRSSAGSGTHDFKMQWGAHSAPLHWDYWLPDGSCLPSTRGSRMRLVSEVWRHLPLTVTNALGPQLIRFIPGI